MSDSPATGNPGSSSPKVGQVVSDIGGIAQTQIGRGTKAVEAVGGMTSLFGQTLSWCYRSIFHRNVKLGAASLRDQMIRVGVASIGIVVLVQMFIGAILALQLAPILESYGQKDKVAVVVAIAIVRELGPLITAIVLSGFAGASIAAEIGAMVESEEIKALKSHALNPIHFLIMPRFLATMTMIVGLAVIADIVGVSGGLLTSWGALGIAPAVYIDITQDALVMKDFITGLIKAGVFGMLISMIACYEGLNVSGGAVGVGRATTETVVKSIVAIIGMDAVFTAVFFVFEL